MQLDNRIVLSGIAQRNAISPSDKFAAVSVECGSNGRKLWADLVAFNGNRAKLARIKQGEFVRALARPESHKGSNGKWRTGFALVQLLPSEQLVIDQALGQEGA
jgi:hypothetical protein